MSRIGKKPIPIPKGVEVTIDGRTVRVKGPKGEDSVEVRPEIAVAQENGHVSVTRRDDERTSRAFHGLFRALIQNMMVGVTQGYEKRLEIHGVGYLASLQGTTLQLRVGFANEIHMEVPDGLTVKCAQDAAAPPATGQCWVVTISGISKQQVGEFAAQVRSRRKPEPYKGKGIRYRGEQIRRKAGKAVTK